MEIKNIEGVVLYCSDKETIKETLVDAVRAHAYLSGADLSDAYLSDANLRGAYLRDADLYGADLSDADLCGANLSGADLRGADLSDANLRDANLRGAYLSGANLYGADLRDADLYGANLYGADLRDADLYGADLYGADLRDADLCGADLRGAKNIPFIPYACPSEGSFTAWKKVANALVMLDIPADAKRCSATSTKCRCDKAKVLGIVDLRTNETMDRITNKHYHETEYVVGEMVYPDSFDEDRWNECSHGIHFFINKMEAINY